MPIRTCTHAGLAAVELTTPAMRLVATHGAGTRIAWFGAAGGDNLLLWDDASPLQYVRTAPGKAWNLRGGHRVWTAQMGADESESTYRPDDTPGTAQVRSDGFTVSSAYDGETRTRRGIDVHVLRDDRLEVVNWIVNEGDMLAGVGLWALTCSKPTPATRYVIPLGDGAEWDTATITVFRCWAGHGTRSFREEQFELTDDAYVLTPRGRETKRMVSAPAGAIAMVDAQRNLTFAIRTEWQQDAAYPANANIAMYVGPENFMVEMETMGPHAVLKPGRRLEHRQEWTLRAGAIPLTGAAVRQFTA
ncbi:MAG: hypothetical protein J0M02_13045 [Planctomycetes bacterium]|nr:hypothetical protein [Planctomycetota bacterium]